jgi:hypothetical protein
MLLIAFVALVAVPVVVIVWAFWWLTADSLQAN